MEIRFAICAGASSCVAVTGSKGLTAVKGKGAVEGVRRGSRVRQVAHTGRRVAFPFPFPSLSSLSRPHLCHSLSPSVPLQLVMTTPHVIASSSTSQTATAGVVGNHFRVGKKIGEGSFGVVFEGIFLLHFSLSFLAQSLASRCKPPHQPACCYQVCE